MSGPRARLLVVRTGVIEGRKSLYVPFVVVEGGAEADVTLPERRGDGGE